MARPSPAQQARGVTLWNERHRVGQLVMYWAGAVQGPGRVTRTRSPAQVMGGHTAVVWLEGQPACVALDHVAALPFNRTDELAYNELVADDRNYLRIAQLKKHERLIWVEGSVGSLTACEVASGPGAVSLASYERMVAAIATLAWSGQATVFEWSVALHRNGDIRRGNLMFERSAAQACALPFTVETRGRPDMDGSLRACSSVEEAQAAGIAMSMKHQACAIVSCGGEFIAHVYKYSGEPRCRISDWGQGKGSCEPSRTPGEGEPCSS